MKRALLVGAGGMGKAWARTILRSEGAQVVGWADIEPGRAADAAQEVGAEGIATGIDYPKLLDQLSPDFVVDVTVPEAHRDTVVHALLAGYPVIGEKPMAHTLDAARDIVAASEKSGKLAMVSQSRRYDAHLAGYRDLFTQTGDPGILASDFYIGAHFGGFRDEMESPLLLDMAIHTFDQARYLLQCDAVAVYCDEHNPEWSWSKGDNACSALFEMAEGVRYIYRGSWVSEGCFTSWQANWRASGPHGTALWDGDNPATGQIALPGERFMREQVDILAQSAPAEFQGGIDGSLAEFLHALDGGPVPQGECHDNIKSLAMVFAAKLSSREKRRVPLSELI